MKSHASGFTLLELMVVLVIMATMLLVVPRMSTGLAGARLRAATAAFADTLRGLRDQAVRTGKPTGVLLDSARRSYRETDASLDKAFPEIVESIQVDGDTPVLGGKAVAIRFFPDGSATSATIFLVHGSRRQIVAIDWLTGRVHSDE